MKTLFKLLLISQALAGAVQADICDRTQQIQDFIVQDRGKASCSDVNDADLLQVTAIRVPNTGITSIKVGDFAGLTNVQTLNLKRNQISEIPVGVFDDLVNVKVVVLLGNNIHSLPDDFMVANQRVTKIHIFQNAFTAISNKVLENLKNLPQLNVLEVGNELDDATKNALRQAFPRENEVVTLIFT
jgi:Leucine rich repeat